MNETIKLFALIGYPLGHTLSPYMHNAGFLKKKIKGLYIPLEVDAKDLKNTVSSLRKSIVCGFNVTIPHKTACMKHLDKIDKLALMIGAVNTVVKKNKKFIGYNTDASGFLKSLKTDLKFLPKNKKCLVIGAGGAGKAAAFALAKDGAKEIYITDIDNPRVNSLVKNIKKHFPKCKVESEACSLKSEVCNIDLVVNATPLGMKEKDPLPIDVKLLAKTTAVYDVVYNPSPTKLVKQAKKRKIKAVNGLGMLLYQGVLAFELWTQKRAPVEVMKKALEDNI